MLEIKKKLRLFFVFTNNIPCSWLYDQNYDNVAVYEVVDWSNSKARTSEAEYEQLNVVLQFTHKPTVNFQFVFRKSKTVKKSI